MIRILFPVRLEVSDGHWVLVVIRLFSFPTGKTYQFSVYNSNKLSRYLPMLGKLAIEPVLVHVSKVLPKKEWKYARKDVECATHQNMEDSGIAVIDNAISVIYGTEMQSDMGAVACYTRREKYARQCLQSGTFVPRVLRTSTDLTQPIQTLLFLLVQLFLDWD